MKIKDRTFTRTGIDWDNWFRDCEIYAQRSIPVSLKKAAWSAAEQRRYSCETATFGDEYVSVIFRRNEPRDKMLRAFCRLSDRQLKALYNAACTAGILEGGML